MRALPITIAFVGSLGAAVAQDARAPVVLPAVAEPGPVAAGSSAARPLAAAETVKASKPLAQQAISSEDARRMMMLLMMRDAASGFPAILLRPAE
jgi:hypothetical protein